MMMMSVSTDSTAFDFFFASSTYMSLLCCLWHLPSAMIYTPEIINIVIHTLQQYEGYGVLQVLRLHFSVEKGPRELQVLPYVQIGGKEQNITCYHDRYAGPSVPPPPRPRRPRALCRCRLSNSSCSTGRQAKRALAVRKQLQQTGP